MSSLGNAIGDIGALTGSNGSTKQLSFTRNPQLQQSLGTLIGNYNTTASANRADLNSYISDFLSNKGTMTANTGQETSAINRFYNGDVARQLAELEAQQSQLGDRAVSQGLAYARGGLNRSIAGGGGGADSSYLNRATLGTATDINLQNDQNLLNQRRGDVMYLNQMPVQLAGQRNALLNATAGYDLLPVQARQNEVGWEAGVLNSLMGANNANNAYAYQYQPSNWQLAGNLVGDLGSTAADVAATYFSGGLAAPMAGSKNPPTSDQMNALSWGAGPMDPYAAENYSINGSNMLNDNELMDLMYPQYANRQLF